MVLSGRGPRPEQLAHVHDGTFAPLRGVKHAG
jgi:hypothetical protein